MEFGEQSLWSSPKHLLSWWCRSLPRTHMCRAGAGGVPSVVPAEGPTANVPGMHAREAQRAHPGGRARTCVLGS